LGPRNSDCGGSISRREARKRGPLPPPVMDDDALWLWGTPLEFAERRSVLERDPNDLLPSMREHMQETTRRLAPRVAAWLEKIR
jgi:hypothetical protein